MEWLISDDGSDVAMWQLAVQDGISDHHQDGTSPTCHAL